MTSHQWISQPDTAWRIAGIAGVLFLAVGGIDALLVWYPLDFGSPEWEFGSVTAALNGLPVPVIGLVLIAVSALQRGNLVLARAAGGAMMLLCLACLGGAVLYGTNVPIALNAVTTDVPTARIGLQKSIVKSIVQLVFFPGGLFLMSLYTFKKAPRGA